MSQRNSETDGMALGLALIGAAFAVLFIALYTVACFIAIVLTILALVAWNTPLTIYKWTITPKEARIFVCCGLVGMIGLPLLVLFSALLLQGRVPGQAWGYLLLGGYSVGALGLGSAILDAEQREEAAKFLALPPPPVQGEIVEVQAAPMEPGPAFRFASWNDENQFLDGRNPR